MKTIEEFKNIINTTVNDILSEYNTKIGADRYFDKDFFEYIPDECVKKMYNAFNKMVKTNEK